MSMKSTKGSGILSCLGSIQYIPTYPSGHWLFGFASKKGSIKDLDTNRWNSLGIKTKYYNTDLHKGCFAIPTYVKELLDDADKE